MAASDYNQKAQAIASINDAKNLMKELGLNLHKKVTRFESTCTSLPNIFVGYVSRISTAVTRQERSAIIAKMIEENLRPCAPQPAQLVLTARKFVGWAIKWISEDENAQEIAKHYDIYMDKMPDVAKTTDLFAHYIKSVGNFRQVMKDQGWNFDEAPTETGETKATISVGTNTAVILKMLARMRKAREGEGATATDTFINQQSKIDPIWFTFFICVHICGVKSEDLFYSWQRGIYTACALLRGKINMLNILNAFTDQKVAGFGKMVAKLSKCKEIYLPPWVLKESRIYEIGAVIGPCDMMNVAGTIKRPAISWRYFLCLDFEKKKEVFNFVTSLWEMEEKTNEGETDHIRLSERVFYEIILGRNAPLANTNFIKGNSLNVTIVD